MLPQISGPSFRCLNGPSTTYTINGAFTTKGIALSFIAVETEIAAFYILVGNAYGTAGDRKLSFELQADVSSAPSGTTLQSYEATGVFPADSAIQIQPSWSGANLTVGARYWIVIKNTATAPTVDYMYITGHTTMEESMPYTNAYGQLSCWGGWKSWNGSVWSAGSASQGLRMVYPSGFEFGAQVHVTVNVEFSSTTKQVGCCITIPDHIEQVNIIGAFFRCKRASTVEDTPLHLFINRSFKATSELSSVPTTGDYIYPMGIFNKVIPAHAGDVVSFLTSAVGNSTSIGYQVSGRKIIKPDLIPDIPFRASIVSRTTSDVWAVTNDYIPECGIYLDCRNPFSGPINRRQFNNQR
jgi:hypothetical protein